MLTATVRQNSIMNGKRTLLTSYFHKKSLSSLQKLEIRPHEKKIFDILNGVVNEFSPSTTLRVAGGWVRDKLLGIHSDDIDIVVDNMGGEKFAKLLCKYQLSKKLARSKIGIVKANPLQSKHLESATTFILNTPIDFVHLRSEKYSESSRIPQIQVGTPLEDALRRDFTINSLFYNLKTKKIEDFTEHVGTRGLEDLQTGTIRTPLPALNTFLDDPLRVLRAIRFAARFNFMVTEEICEAAKNVALHDAFNNKISKHRIGVEVTNILGRPGYSRGLALLDKFTLWDLVFSFTTFKPNGHNSCISDVSGWTPESRKLAIATVECLETVCAELQKVSQESRDISPSQCKVFAGIFAALLPKGQQQTKYQQPPECEKLKGNVLPQPISNLSCQEFFKIALSTHHTIKSARGKYVALMELVMKENLKLSSKEMSNVVTLLAAIQAFPFELKSGIDSSNLDDMLSMLKSDQGKLNFLIWMRSFKDVWRNAVLLYVLSNSSFEEKIPNVVLSFQRYFTHIQKYKMEENVQLKPLLTGVQISKVFSALHKQNIGIGVELLAAWQAMYPSKDTAEASQFIENLQAFLVDSMNHQVRN